MVAYEQFRVLQKLLALHVCPSDQFGIAPTRQKLSQVFEPLNLSDHNTYFDELAQQLTIILSRWAVDRKSHLLYSCRFKDRIPDDSETVPELALFARILTRNGSLTRMGLQEEAPKALERSLALASRQALGRLRSSSLSRSSQTPRLPPPNRLHP